MPTAIAFAIEAMNVLPGLIAAGIDIVQFVSETTDKLKAMKEENRDPTDEEWEALNKLIEDLREERVDAE